VEKAARVAPGARLWTVRMSRTDAARLGVQEVGGTVYLYTGSESGERLQIAFRQWLRDDVVLSCVWCAGGGA
jgi:hypothetical protein